MIKVLVPQKVDKPIEIDSYVLLSACVDFNHANLFVCASSHYLFTSSHLFLC